MRVDAYLRKVAYVNEMQHGDPPAYFSKYDDSFIAFVGMEKDVRLLARHEITDCLTRGVGYSPKDHKWYGWSHRMIYGFTIGSTCKIGDCHFVARTIEEEVENTRLFWLNEGYENTKVVAISSTKIEVTLEIKDEDGNIKHKTHVDVFDPDYVGRGEWVAKTMDDAKRMAEDYNRGVG